MKRFTSFVKRQWRLVLPAGAAMLMLGYLVLAAGPLAAIPVTVTTVSAQPLSPSWAGLGTVEARYTHKLGAVHSSRLLSIAVETGDRVVAGQLLAEFDGVELDSKIAAQDAALSRAEANLAAARAQLEQAEIKARYAAAQAQRYQQLAAVGTVSLQSAELIAQEFRVAEAGVSAAGANLAAAEQERARMQAERAGLQQQKANLQLRAPVAGLISRRWADVGSSMLAGQTVLELVEPERIWLNVRLALGTTAQASHSANDNTGLRAGLPVQIRLRSRAETPLAGRIARIEPYADPVTEETLIKVEFEQMPVPQPALSELLEVRVTLPELPPLPVLPDAALHEFAGALGVWRVRDSDLQFVPVQTGARDDYGRLQIPSGLAAGDQVVVYSRQALTPSSRIRIVDSLLPEQPVVGRSSNERGGGSPTGPAVVSNTGVVVARP